MFGISPESCTDYHQLRPKQTRNPGSCPSACANEQTSRDQREPGSVGENVGHAEQPGCGDKCHPQCRQPQQSLRRDVHRPPHRVARNVYCKPHQRSSGGLTAENCRSSARSYIAFRAPTRTSGQPNGDGVSSHPDWDPPSTPKVCALPHRACCCDRTCSARVLAMAPVRVRIMNWPCRRTCVVCVASCRERAA